MAVAASPRPAQKSRLRWACRQESGRPLGLATRTLTLCLHDLMVTKKETRKDSMEAVEEHRVIDLLLLGLEDFPRDHERWPIKFEVFQEYTEHHFKEEEDDIFPKGTKVLGEAEMRDMGVRFAATTERQLAVL